MPLSTSNHDSCVKFREAPHCRYLIDAVVHQQTCERLLPASARPSKMTSPVILAVDADAAGADISSQTRLLATGQEATRCICAQSRSSPLPRLAYFIINLCFYFLNFMKSKICILLPYTAVR
jgi:hypothetical protein